LAQKVYIVSISESGLRDWQMSNFKFQVQRCWEFVFLEDNVNFICRTYVQYRFNSSWHQVKFKRTSSRCCKNPL